MKEPKPCCKDCLSKHNMGWNYKDIGSFMFCAFCKHWRICRLTSSTPTKKLKPERCPTCHRPI